MHFIKENLFEFVFYEGGGGWGVGVAGVVRMRKSICIIVRCFDKGGHALLGVALTKVWDSDSI